MFHSTQVRIDGNSAEKRVQSFDFQKGLLGIFEEFLMVKAVRGAIGVEKNTADDIEKAACTCVDELVRINSIRKSDIVSILFSQTRDLYAKNPATSLRGMGYGDVPLFCVQEPEYEGSLPMIIRVLITYETPETRRPVPVYLGRAKTLRPDLFEEKV